MSHSNGKITRPVSAQVDVIPTLGLSTSNGSEAYICQNTHGKINKWALKKPVDSEDLFPVANNVPQWWKGTDKDCGFTFTYGNTLPTITYRAPNKSIIGMFDGYNHNAVCGLAFKESTLTHNLLSGESLTVALEDAEDSVTLYDLKDMSLFSGLVPCLMINSTGDNIPFYKIVKGNWNSRSITFEVGSTILEYAGVGEVRCEAILLNPSTMQDQLYAFPSESPKRSCMLNLTAVTNITYSWSNPQVYDPVKKGYYALSNYGRFSNPGLVIDAMADISGFVMSTAYLTQAAASPVEAASSENMYIVFEWYEYTNSGNKRYRVKSRLQAFENNVFKDFSINKGGGRTGQFGLDYRYLPKFTDTTQCQFYLCYRKWDGGTERFYRIMDRQWLKLKCPIGQATAQEI